jgi:hypothetical protein
MMGVPGRRAPFSAEWDAMVHEYAVFFHYYRDCPVTTYHFDRVRRLNPGVPVVPVCAEGPAHLPGTIDLRGTLPPDEAADLWSYCDHLLYRGFERRPVEAKRWIVMEWDARMDASMPEIWREAWDCPVAAQSWCDPESDPYWNWWPHRRYLPDFLQPYPMGILMATALYSHEALERLVAAVPRDRVYCELRLGSTLRYLGFTPCWLPHPELQEHPVKEIIEPEVKAADRPLP